MNNPYLWQIILVTGGVTFLLRAFPFLLFSSGKQPPAVIGYIGKVLSPAAIAMLVVYCFGCYIRDRVPATHCYGLAELAGAVTVIAFHLWKRNALLSILLGTAVYMLLVQTIIP